MKDEGRRERPEPQEGPAAFQRFQKLTKALLGVPKDEYDRKRAEYERQAQERREQRG